VRIVTPSLCSRRSRGDNGHFKVKVLDKLVNADELFRSISQTKAN